MPRHRGTTVLSLATGRVVVVSHMRSLVRSHKPQKSGTSSFPASPSASPEHGFIRNPMGHSITADPTLSSPLHHLALTADPPGGRWRHAHRLLSDTATTRPRQTSWDGFEWNPPGGHWRHAMRHPRTAPTPPSPPCETTSTTARSRQASWDSFDRVGQHTQPAGSGTRGLVEARSLQRTQGRKVSCIPTPEESDAIFGDVASLMTPRHGISHPSPTVIGVGTTTPGNYTSRVGSKPATNLTSPLHKIFPELKACTHAHQLDLPVPWMGHIGTTGGGATAASNKRNGIRHRSGCRALGTGVFHCECGGQKGLKKLDKARKRSLKQMKKESLLIRKIESQMRV